jgi:hypothetical protein
MSFFSSLVYYRPTAPPSVTGDDLARFLDLLAQSGAIAQEWLLSLDLKFGRRIDKDAKPATWLEPIKGHPYTARYRDIKWDVDVKHDPGNVAMLLQHLRGEPRSIYRAYIGLGSLADEAAESLRLPPSAENELTFCPDSLSVEVGPVQLCRLACEEPAEVGWVEVRFSGNGYLYPYTLRDLIARAESSPAVRRVTDACRSFWPVEPLPPDAATIGLRKQMGKLWPYDDLDRPWDWYWGIHETG